MSRSSDMAPSYTDVIYRSGEALSDFVQVLTGSAKTTFARAQMADTNPGAYDPISQSWEGERYTVVSSSKAGGMKNGDASTNNTITLRYKVPLQDVPSERHADIKSRNIRVLMDNVRNLCIHDELPCTPDEKKFWAQYRFLKYQLFLTPFLALFPPLYLGCRVMHTKLPRYMQGRIFPFVVSAIVAEQIAEQTYPGYEMLSRALTAKTPLGDAARAEWQRLQPLTLTMQTYTHYQMSMIVGEGHPGLRFGADVREIAI